MQMIKVGKVENNKFMRSLEGSDEFINVFCAFDNECACGPYCAAFYITNPAVNPDMVGAKFYLCARLPQSNWVMARKEGTGSEVKIGDPDANVEAEIEDAE